MGVAQPSCNWTERITCIFRFRFGECIDNAKAFFFIMLSAHYNYDVDQSDNFLGSLVTLI